MKLGGFLKDIDGAYSSKRLCGAIAMSCIVAAVWFNVHGHALSDALTNVLGGIVMAGIFGAVGERFGRSRYIPPMNAERGGDAPTA